MRLIRNDVNKNIELMRTAKTVGANAECQVYLYSSDPDLRSKLKAMQGDKTFGASSESTNGMDDLRFILMTSRVTVVDSRDAVSATCSTDYTTSIEESESGLMVGVCKADGKKCDRCWYYSDSVGDDTDHPEVCMRCATVVKKDGYQV